MKILICNDDGIESKGLYALVEKLSTKNDVLVVAPDKNCSAVSHSLTIREPIFANKVNYLNGVTAYSICGTPVDCVKFAKLVLKDFVPDLVVAGINKGHNLGSDILYSGTVSIAYEAAFFGHKAFAFSAFSHNDGDFTLYAEYAQKIIDVLYPITKPKDIWNVNFPDFSQKINGVKFAVLGSQVYTDFYVQNENGYSLVGKEGDKFDNAKNSDVQLISKGYVTVTPLIYDKTNFSKLNQLKNITF